MGRLHRVPNVQLVAARETCNWTQETLAAKITQAAAKAGAEVYCDVRMVGRWESGEIQWPHARYRQFLESVLGKSSKELGFIPRSERKSLALGSEPSSTLAQGILFSQNGDPSARDPSVVARILLTLPDHAQAASSRGSRELIPVGVSHVKFLYSGYDAARGKDRLQLLNACARYAEFLGWLYQDIDRPHDALFWSDRAMEWAQEANDPLFVSYVLMRKSDQAEDYGSAERVIGLAEAAVRMAGDTPRSMALALQQEARGHAQGGDPLLFERSLGKARQYLASASGLRDAPWGDYCTPTYVAMQEATGWLELGEHSRSIEIFERELPKMSESDRVDNTVFRSRLARAYAESRSADRAARTALDTWETTCATGTGRALKELARVRQLITSGERSDAVEQFVSAFDSHSQNAGPYDQNGQANERFYRHGHVG